MSLRALSVPSGLWIAATADGQWKTELAVPLLVQDTDLPVRILCEQGLVVEGAGPGVFCQPSPPRVTGDGRREFVWNPFAESLGQRLNQSYGEVALLLKGPTFGEFRLHIEVVPSGLSLRQLSAMRHTVARVADELLRSGRVGATRTPVGLAGSASPREPAETQQQLERYVRPALHAIRSIAARPYVTQLGRRPSLRRMQFPQNPSIDVAENRFVGHAVRTWCNMLNDCMLKAQQGATDARARPAAFKAEHSEKVPKAIEQESEADAARYLGLAETARNLRKSLVHAARPLLELPRPDRSLHITPRTQRRADYHQLMRTFTQIRREVSVATAERDATRPDTLASFLYERWVLFALAQLSMNAGYKPVGDAWLSPVDIGRYEVTVKASQPWAFSADGWQLELAYEPVLVSMKKKGPGSSRDAGIRRLLEDVAIANARGYTVGAKRTPDYLILLTHDSGNATLIVGDAQFNQITEADVAHPAQPVAETRWAHLREKTKVVQTEYARKIWVVRDDGGVVPCVDHLGFVVFPGPIAARSELGADDADFRLLPLSPVDAEPSAENFGDGIANCAMMTSMWRELLDEAKRVAERPSRVHSHVLGPFRLR